MAILSPALKATTRGIEPYLNQIPATRECKCFFQNSVRVVKLLPGVQNKTELDLAVEKTSNKTLLEFQP